MCLCAGLVTVHSLPSSLSPYPLDPPERCLRTESRDIWAHCAMGAGSISSITEPPAKCRNHPGSHRTQHHSHNSGNYKEIVSLLSGTTDVQMFRVKVGGGAAGGLCHVRKPTHAHAYTRTQNTHAHKTRTAQDCNCEDCHNLRTPELWDHSRPEDPSVL